jgi:hypothetical protein
MQSQLPVQVKGHVHIEDDLGDVLLDQDNAIHPRNMARLISRALAHESNSWVNRIAFGNGGTVVDAAFQITYNPPNDGLAPDPAGWESRLYNETYSEIIDESDLELGQGPGANPGGDPPSVEHVSGPGVRSTELGLTSEVVVEVVLNPGEPSGQYASDDQAPIEDTESDFSFDEIGLFTPGLPNIQTAGYQNVDISNKVHTDITGLAPNFTYTFNITVDGGVQQTINVTTPSSGSGASGEILFSDIVPLINAQMVGATSSVTDGTNQTFGYLKFSSNTVGTTSSTLIEDLGAGNYPTNFLFSNIVGFLAIDGASGGEDAGVQNDPTNPDRERERMLTHIIFSPVLKSANRTLTITYTLTVSVARSV